MTSGGEEPDAARTHATASHSRNPKQWAYLFGAIVTEVAGTMSLRAAVDQPLWVIAVIVGYLAAFALLALALREGMPVGVAYGVWGGIGVALTAVLGTVLFAEMLSPTDIGGIVLIVIGVALVETGSHPPSPVHVAESPALEEEKS